MFNKIKNFMVNCNEKRIARRNKPWSKKQKIVFLSVLSAILLYAIISMTMSGNSESFNLPDFKFSVNGLDIILILLLCIGFTIFKIRAYIKRRKGDKK